MITPGGGTQETRIFTEDGIYEVTMIAKTEKAREFRHWVRKVLKSLRKGNVEDESSDLKKKEMLIEQTRRDATLINAQTRKAKLMIDMTKNMRLGQQANELLCVKAAEILTGEPISYRPRLEPKTYKATDIGKMLGVSANKIGRLANEHGLKTEEYGNFVLDQSRYSHKQVSSFLYNEAGLNEIKRIFTATDSD